MNYCGQAGGRPAGSFELTALDRLGASILYPTSSERPALLTSAVFALGDGSQLCREDLAITTDWLEAGADPLVFGGPPPTLGGLGIDWKVDNVTATFGTTFPMLLLNNYSGASHAVRGVFTDIYGRSSTVTQRIIYDCGELDTSAHTAVLMSALCP